MRSLNSCPYQKSLKARGPFLERQGYYIFLIVLIIKMIYWSRPSSSMLKICTVCCAGSYLGKKMEQVSLSQNLLAFPSILNPEHPKFLESGTRNLFSQSSATPHKYSGIVAFYGKPYCATFVFMLC